MNSFDAKLGQLDILWEELSVKSKCIFISEMWFSYDIFLGKLAINGWPANFSTSTYTVPNFTLNLTMNLSMIICNKKITGQFNYLKNQ